MDFTNLLEESEVVTGMDDGISIVGVTDIVLTPVIGTDYSGMIVISTLCSFSLTSFSI
jgi:hypothetical protein